MNKLSGWNDTIVAIATAPGIGAIAVIRISGENAFAIINELFPSKNLLQQASHTMHVGMLKENEAAIDEVVVSLFKGPKSFTGEDTIEISCHGSPYIQQQIIEACVRQGARLARAGEFTQRAFLNGKLDLTQAEAVADIIASNTRASQKTALQNIKGGFSNDLKNMREQLLQFAALIELELDFATEDVEFADRQKFYNYVNTITLQTQNLVNSFQLGNVIKNGVSVAIIGKPNAGKSTLLNSLLNDERAIVSPIAGTTRDTIEETLNIKGILFRLIDTAGIRTHSLDSIENIGIERSKQNAAKADIIVEVLDMTDEEDNEEQDWLKTFANKTIVVQNKYDVWITKNEAEGLSVQVNTPNILLSANDGYGVEDLKEALYNKAMGESGNTENTIITNSRHHEALQHVLQSLHEIKAGLDNNLPGDLLALDIRRCLYYLGEITGEITNEDKLDYIFSKFCIGK
ncbi:MAG: tRNA uridine-5-carboxymethylaminomethyl(34) synthesis GTPase MnmE [Sphingobacteriales bacterium]|nr:MAG: tRNA uridine-5-carboxymethylaminomethyl(34) synthesis GTPase MnmE [Sphingobacteriales bacterium]